MGNISFWHIALTILGLYTVAVAFVLLKITGQKLCPQCQHRASIRRLHRPAFFKTVFFFLPLAMYRCFHCGNLFFKLAKNAGPEGTE